MAGTGDNMKNDHQYAEVLEMMWAGYSIVIALGYTRNM